MGNTLLEIIDTTGFKNILGMADATTLIELIAVKSQDLKLANNKLLWCKQKGLDTTEAKAAMREHYSTLTRLMRKLEVSNL